MRISSTVEHALRMNEQARSSDKILLIQVWHDMGLDLDPKQMRKFLDIPSPETITRVRRKLQEEGKYLGDKEVMEERKFMGLTVQQNAPSATTERLSDLIQGELL